MDIHQKVWKIQLKKQQQANCSALCAVTDSNNRANSEFFQLSTTSLATDKNRLMLSVKSETCLHAKSHNEYTEDLHIKTVCKAN